MKKILTYQTKIKVFDCPKRFAARGSSQQSLMTSLMILLFMMGGCVSWGQTAFSMSSSNYTANFADITNWTNNFAAGTGAANFGSVGIGAGSGAAGNVTSGTRTTKSSTTFVASTTGGIQKGTQALQFLSTGSTAMPEAVAVDLLLDFTGRNAGTLSFDWAAIDNSSGTRPTSLRVFYSTDNITYTEITGAQVLDKVSTNTGSITSVALPAALNNVATARIRFYNHAGAITGLGSRDKMQIDNISVTSTAPGSITGAATTAAFNTTYGTASTAQTFTVSGAGLIANLVATAPTGFQVSSDGTTYGTTATFTQTSGTASGTLSIRLATTATVASTYNAQNIVLSSTGATSANITTPVSGNSVTAKALTITSVTADNKTYDGTTTATLSGTAAYSGLVNGETFTVTGTATAIFASANVGTGIAVTVTGYTAPSTNYTVAQPTGLTADITACTTPTITLGSNPSVCSGATSANLTYSATTGTPNQYSITYSTAAMTAGFTDVINATLSSTPIVLVVPAAAAATYNATLTVTNSTTGCVSAVSNITVTINARPSVTTTKVDDLCQVGVGSITVTITGGSPNYAVAACGTTITPSPTVGTYIPVTGMTPAMVTSSGGSTTFSNLQGNADYKLTVTDANGCINQ